MAAGSPDARPASTELSIQSSRDLMTIRTPRRSSSFAERHRKFSSRRVFSSCCKLTSRNLRPVPRPTFLMSSSAFMVAGASISDRTTPASPSELRTRAFRSGRDSAPNLISKRLASSYAAPMALLAASSLLRMPVVSPAPASYSFAKRGAEPGANPGASFTPGAVTTPSCACCCVSALRMSLCWSVSKSLSVSPAPLPRA